MNALFKPPFEAGFTAAIAASSTGVVLSDPHQPDNPLVYVNPAFLEMSGYTADEVVGRSCRILQGPETNPETVDEIRSALRERRGVTLRLRNYRKNGSTFWNELIVNPVFGEDGRLLNFVGIQKDVTAEVTANHALIEKIEALDASNQALLTAQEALRHLAYYDGLTGLASRTLFYDRLRQALTRCQRSGDMLAVLLLDLDGFKAINDRFGHEAGDIVLAAAARRMSARTRAADTLARLGGDEFVLLLADDVTVQAAEQACRRLRAAFAEVFELNGATARLDVSIGVAVYPLHADDGDSLLRHADAAMYAIKRLRHTNAKNNN